MKAVIWVKLDRIGLECVENKFLKLPNIQKYEVVQRTEDGFIASVEMDDGYEFQINYSESKRPTFRSDRYQFTVVMPNLNYNVTQDVAQDVTQDVT